MRSKKKERMEMENNNSNSGGKFVNGFLLGALIGVGVVFLLGTKKGKKVLKTISEEGLSSIPNILEKVEKFEDIDEDQEVERVTPQKKATPAEDELGDESEDVRPKVKRFFKGISKRFN